MEILINESEVEEAIAQYLKAKLGMDIPMSSLSVVEGIACITIEDTEPQQLNLPLENSDTETDPPFVADAAAVDTEGFFKK
jgi:hypothetical protein